VNHPHHSSTFIDVAAAIVRQADGRVLLAERPTGKPWAGYWEFPGGKIEAGEAPLAALARELHEELGIELDAATPWITFVHDYPEKSVRLHFFRVSRWHGTPYGREGQRLAWEEPDALTVSPLLPANEIVLRDINLPSLYAITQAGKLGVEAFMPRLNAALEGGVRLIQIRERELSAEALTLFTQRVVKVAHTYGARVLVNGDPMIAKQTGADGVHLQSSQLMQLDTPPLNKLWAASCHDARELERAVILGASFVVLSPVLPTASHPGEPGIGWKQFATLIRNTPLPVYALGGMKPELLATAMQHGAHGVALLSGIW
jgi:8-oxo-dGTP diphosphatase